MSHRQMKKSLQAPARSPAPQLLTVLRLNPRSPQVPLAHFNLGLIYGRQGRWEEAAIEYEQALALNPEFAPTRQQLAAARAHLAKRNR